MSLKSKLEAVIYAAEEPVTLAQLSALFGEEALEWQAREVAAASETGLAASAGQLLPAENEEFAYAEYMEAGPAEPAPYSVDPPTAPPPEAPAAPEVEPAAEQDAPAEPAVADVEARRLARQRDREARDVLRGLLDELTAEYAADGRGIELREIAGGYRMATKPEYHDAVRSFVKSLKPPLKLSLPALETLAVIAYKQPVTAPEVNDIRGVDSSAVFGSLLARKLIVTAGRKPVVGRPILYKTTREFLLRFGLKDVSELPSMEEFEKMAALELEDPEEAAAGDAERPPKPDLNPALEFDPDAEDPPAEQMAAAPAQPPPAEAARPQSTQSPAEPVETEASPHDP